MAELSPALRVVNTLYHNSWEHGGSSFRRLNNALRLGMLAAIEAGLHFDLDDFISLRDGYKFGYWGGQDNDQNFGEQFYTAAVKANNMSACQAFEQYTQRKPYIYDGKRLHLRQQIFWDGVPRCVTSFHDKEGYLIATHRDDQHDRIRITHSNLHAFERLRKELKAEKETKRGDLNC